MRTILVLNPKGGSGKTTLATNIASYFSIKNKKVTLADCDPQGSSQDWLKMRPDKENFIYEAVLTKRNLKVSKDTDILVMDTPAGVTDKRLSKFLNQAQTMIIPVIASPIDIRAAEHFIEKLFSLKGTINHRIKIATVANRVREDTLIAAKLEYYLDKLKLPDGKRLPFVTMLRQSQNYINAAERGLSIFELPPSKTYYDREQWEPLLRWLNSSKSQPNN
ncbi:MAG: chromosome partitioning protein [Legionellales bacterium]|nr:chromosome partitioning protein [Legionellales bacterium]|tara:strand:- start:353 stop:1012 length:660 start_codon:yes stop_codon:yes gene_type:complete